MQTADCKTFPHLRTAFVAAERRLRANKGMGVQQGHTNNIEDLQRALEGLTEATAQEREDNAATKAQSEFMQAAVNALQLQMVSVGQGGSGTKAVQMQQPQHTQMQANKTCGSTKT